MKALTLRNIPPPLAKAIQRRAAANGTSLTRAVLGFLEEAAGLRKVGAKPVAHRDLTSLAGSWTDEEAAEFDRVLAEQRKIDPEMWR